MHIRKLLLLAAILCSVCCLNAQRYEQLLETGWKFHKGEANGAEATTRNGNQSVFHTTGPFMDRLTATMTYRM